MKKLNMLIGTIFLVLPFTVSASSKPLCKRATTLHTEICNQTYTTAYCSGAGYTASGSKGTTTITYGNLGTKGILASGDAFDCDVNGDGIYNSNNERFYYVSGLNGDNSNNIAVLIYYNNVSGGVANNTAAYAYDESGENWHGPRDAISQLPTTSQWKNVSLSNTIRAITNVIGGNTTTYQTNTYDLPTNFSYAGYAARLLTIQELNKACGITTSLGLFDMGSLDNCNYVLENTEYSNESLKTGYWLETTLSPGSISEAVRIHSSLRSVWDVGGVGGRQENSVRPVIEVSKAELLRADEIDNSNINDNNNTNTSIKDKNNDINITAPSNFLKDKTLESKVINKETKEYKDIQEKIKKLNKNITRMTIYDVNLMEAGQKVQPNEKVTLDFEIPSGYDARKVVVYRVDDDGSMTKLKSSVKNGRIYVETNHFSYYIIVEEEQNVGNIVKNPNTTDSNIIKTFVILGSLISVSIITLKLKLKLKNY